MYTNIIDCHSYSYINLSTDFIYPLSLEMPSRPGYSISHVLSLFEIQR